MRHGPTRWGPDLPDELRMIVRTLRRRSLILSVSVVAVPGPDGIARARSKTPTDRDPLDATSIGRERARQGYTGITDTDPTDLEGRGRSNDRDPTDPPNRGRRGSGGLTDSDPADPPGRGRSGR